MELNLGNVKQAVASKVSEFKKPEVAFQGTIAEPKKAPLPENVGQKLDASV